MRAVLILASLLFFSAGISHGDTYSYTDEKGTPCFTDNYSSIPERFREGASLIIKDERIERAPEQPVSRESGVIDESLLPGKGRAEREEVSEESAAAGLPDELESAGFPYLNVAIMSSLFLGALIPTFFLTNKMAKRILRAVSTASILMLLFYISAFFVSKYMHAMRKDAQEMTDALNKKEADKEKALQDAVGNILPRENN